LPRAAGRAMALSWRYPSCSARAPVSTVLCASIAPAHWGTRSIQMASWRLPCVRASCRNNEPFRGPHRVRPLASEATGRHTHARSHETLLAHPRRFKLPIDRVRTRGGDLPAVSRERSCTASLGWNAGLIGALELSPFNRPTPRGLERHPQNDASYGKPKGIPLLDGLRKGPWVRIDFTPDPTDINWGDSRSIQYRWPWRGRTWPWRLRRR
jgi:hypothetical protein